MLWQRACNYFLYQHMHAGYILMEFMDGSGETVVVGETAPVRRKKPFQKFAPNQTLELLCHERNHIPILTE